MDELRNLQQMASLASGRFNQYDGVDFVLPDIFKEQVTEINSNTITYNKYSAIIETRGSQHGILNIFMPNQWFYIASYFTDFYNELQKYKRYALQVTTKERLKELNGNELTGSELNNVSNLDLDEASKKRLIRFITDYSWWGGAKTIDRGDFYVSPILANANLVNASQSFVADLCAFLANKQELVQAIINKEENNRSAKHSRVLLFPPCIESKEGINGFLDRAIPIVLERDADLYRLDKFVNVDGGIYLTIGRHNLGRASDKDARPNDINPNIEWTCGLNGKRYYLNREVTYPNFVTFQEAFNEAYKGIFEIVIDTIDYNGTERKRYSLYAVSSAAEITDIEDSPYRTYLTALRTKPFLLLAGISGTGKSRIVKEIAFACCPDVAELRNDPVSPGNYLLVEVKPNWHDSTELLGYESTIKKGYVLTPFVKFLYKAMKHPDVPFFVCLDEMNLAPVEQYFAEFLSILESRKQQADGTILTEPLIRADIFRKYPKLYEELNGKAKELDVEKSYRTVDFVVEYTPSNYGKEYEMLCEEGLRIPQNVVVIGTVNMDETTHQFSRKVIDRAMTIEMNEVKFDGFFESSSELTYPDRVLPKEYFLPCHTTAGKALESVPDDAEYIKANVPAMLAQLNEALADTPFKIAYRVQNELVLYFAALRQEEAHKATGTAELLATAMDQILMMKVLPRIEGDDELLEKPLERLAVYAEGYPKASAKIKEMQERLGRSHFASFWP